jgi:dTDP-4-amino-4,6-dideoxygalactose transaminase
MYRIGRPEIDAVARVIKSGKVFRYGIGGECDRFEKRYAKFVGSRHCALTASGTQSLAAALIGAGIGPGDEVIVPACTYMATAIAVVIAGAIPVIADIDESLTLSPLAFAAAIGPRTHAVIPVHMWGLPCDMDQVLAVARAARVLVIEDACQAVGGAYEGRKLGSLGDAGAFSFNYYKNMTAGEGGAVVTSRNAWAERIRCAIDPCNFYWRGRASSRAGFVANGARSSEFEGAILNEQLDRIDGMIRAMRKQKKRILAATADTELEPIPANSLDWECGTHVMYRLPTPGAADAFAAKTGGTVTLKTGRHVYTEWDQILQHRGSHHPALNPFELAANKGCRMDYSRDMCRASLAILGRTVYLQTHPDRTPAETDALIERIRAAVRTALSPRRGGSRPPSAPRARSRTPRRRQSAGRG